MRIIIKNTKINKEEEVILPTDESKLNNKISQISAGNRKYIKIIGDYGHSIVNLYILNEALKKGLPCCHVCGGIETIQHYRYKEIVEIRKIVSNQGIIENTPFRKEHLDNSITEEYAFCDECGSKFVYDPDEEKVFFNKKIYEKSDFIMEEKKTGEVSIVYDDNMIKNIAIEHGIELSNKQTLSLLEGCLHEEIVDYFYNEHGEYFQDMINEAIEVVIENNIEKFKNE